MKNVCCGKPLLSKFCPRCGKERTSSDSLLAYLEHELDLATTRVSRIKECLDPTYKYYNERHKARHEGNLINYKSRVTRLAGWVAWVKLNKAKGVN